MRERSTKCTLYSAYVTPDDPRGAPIPAGTRRGPPGRSSITTVTDTLSTPQQSCSQHILESGSAALSSMARSPRSSVANDASKDARSGGIESV